MKLADLYVYQRDNVNCTLCKGCGQVMLEDDWLNPRPCPVCRGVGQIHESEVPTEVEIAHMMMNYRF